MSTRHTCLESMELGAFYGGADLKLYDENDEWTLEVESRDRTDAAVAIRYCPYCGIRLPGWNDGEMLWVEFRKVQHIQ